MGRPTDNTIAVFNDCISTFASQKSLVYLKKSVHQTKNVKEGKRNVVLSDSLLQAMYHIFQRQNEFPEVINDTSNGRITEL